MQISGQTSIRVPPQRAIAALHDRSTLERFLLGSSALEETGPAQFSFAIQRKLGLITLNLPGRLSVTPVTADRVYQFDARASHKLGGSVHLSLEMTFEPEQGGTSMAWNGVLGSSGLARQVLREKQDRIPVVVQNMMSEFKIRVQRDAQHEARYRRS